MFGQNRSGFGAPSGTGFGGGGFGANTSTGFGQSSFGNKPTGAALPAFQSTGFGATNSLFGNPTTTTSQPAGGLFGATTPAFGAAQPTTGFGAPAPSTGFGFGGGTSGGTMFGATTPASTGMFGAPAQAAPATGTTGMFGAANTGFGAQPKPAFGFGATSTASGLFGQPQPTQTSSIFGQPTAQAAPATGSLFGGSSFGGGATAFGSGQTQTGTTVKFSAPAGTDTMMKNNIQTTINTHHQCITCMKEYENKSLEELRMEDYAAGRKGPTPGAQPAGGLFGASSTPQTGFGFGQTQQQKPLFGAPSTTGIGQTPSLFGQSQQAQSAFGVKPTGFAQPTTSTQPAFGFGQPAQQTTSLFGQPQVNKPFGATGGTSIFGAPTTSQPSSVFGAQPAATSTFGFGATPQQQQPSSLFTAKPAFGATTSTPGFGFPQTTTTTSVGSSLFGAKPATGFGASSTSVFGTTPAQTTTTGFSGFGSGTGLFGAPSTNTPFGAKPAGQLTFGATTSTAPTLGFGQTSTSSLFGGQQGATTAKPLFGGTTPSFGSSGFGTTTGFGSTTGIGAPSTGSLFGASGINTGTSNFGGAQTAAAGQMPIHQYFKTLSEITQSSDHPLFRKLLEPSGKAEELIKSSSKPASTGGGAPTPPQYRISPMPSSKIRTKALLNGSSNASGRRSIFEGMSDEEEGEERQDSENKTDFFVPRRSVKKLQLKAVSLDSTVDEESRNTEQPQSGKITSRTPNEDTPIVSDSARAVELRNAAREELDDSLTVLKIRRPPVYLNQSASLHLRDNDRSSILEETGLGGVDDTIADEVNESAEDENVPPHPAGIVLRRCGYSTMPSLEDLAIKGMDDEGKCIVSSFTIIRKGYGQIYFEGPLDVANLNLDSIVIFRHKEVTVYPDDSNKPPQGEGLNRRAEITLDRVWPVDKATGEYITDNERLILMRYEDRLARAAHRLQAKFIEYRPDTGSWVFRVNHFSKYGLEDSDEENELPTVPPKLPPAALPTLQGQAAQVNQSAGLGGLSTTIAASMSMVLEEDMGVEEDIMFQPPDLDDSQSGRIQSPPPAATQLARTLGMPSQRVQIMKASFFDADNDYAQDVSMGIGSFLNQSSRVNQPALTRKGDLSLSLRDTAVSSPKSQSLFKAGAIAVIQQKPQEKMELNQTAQDVSMRIHTAEMENLSSYLKLDYARHNPDQLKKIVPRFASAEIPLPRSLMRGKVHVVSDSALFHNRQTRIGWGPDLELLEFLNSARLSHVSVNTADLKQPSRSDKESHYSDNKDPYVALLTTYLSHVRRSTIEDVPMLHAGSGCDAVAALRTATESLISRLKSSTDNKTMSYLNYMLKVWKLVLALWGPLDAESGLHAETMARKEMLTHWLEEAAMENPISGLQDEEEVLTLLARHDVAGAARLAHKNGEFYLALLISQAGSSTAFKSMLQRQLHMWTDNRSDSFITKDRLRLFALLAGVPVWESTVGKINTCQGMDWIKALGHHLWYVISPVGSITDALIEYENACGIVKESDELDIYAREPIPSYAQTTSTFRDTCFQLISLYCHRSVPLEKVINPLCHTENVCENVLSWLLWQQLQALGYSHLSETAAAQITTTFASQLENCGLWQWAVFVAMHLKSTPAFVQSFVEDIIGRHVHLTADEPLERFLIEQLGVPSRWIEKARAVKALQSFSPRLQAQSLLAAGLYSEAHDVICDELAPEAILSESYQELEGLLGPLADPERSSMIADWSVKGRIYWNYITVVKAVEKILNLLNANEKGIQLEKLTPDLTSLCNLVSSLPVPTAKHRLVRTEIAQKAAYILKNVIGLQSINASEEIVVPPRFVLPQLRQLPVTQDYSLSELNNVVRAYFLELKV